MSKTNDKRKELLIYFNSDFEQYLENLANENIERGRLVVPGIVNGNNLSDSGRALKICCYKRTSSDPGVIYAHIMNGEQVNGKAHFNVIDFYSAINGATSSTAMKELLSIYENHESLFGANVRAVTRSKDKIEEQENAKDYFIKHLMQLVDQYAFLPQKFSNGSPADTLLKKRGINYKQLPRIIQNEIGFVSNLQIPFMKDVTRFEKQIDNKNGYITWEEYEEAFSKTYKGKSAQDLPRAFKSGIIFKSGNNGFTIRIAQTDNDKNWFFVTKKMEIEKNTQRILAYGKRDLKFSNTIDKNRPVFITEGEFDALSFWAVGSQAIALGGVGNTNLLEKWAKENKTKYPLILALDEDRAGVDTTQALTRKLKDIEVPTIMISSYDRKDPNEYLIKDRKGFSKFVKDEEERSVKMLVPEKGAIEKTNNNHDFQTR